jgi:hypothetical protein
MMLEMIGRLGLEASQSVIDHNHRNFLGLVQIGHRFGHCARGFRTTIPGDEDTVGLTLAE